MKVERETRKTNRSKRIRERRRKAEGNCKNEIERDRDIIGVEGVRGELKM